MKHFFTFLLSIVLGVAFGREISPHQNVDAKDHLLTVNKQWVYFEDAIPDEKQSFSNDTERIAYHLRTVVELLSAQTTTHLNSVQLEKRKQTIQILAGYADRKVFPTNHYHAVRQPYFIDNYDVHCAVGYLVKETGYPEISKEIARTQNYAYVKEIKSEALLQWANEYGFSVQELALIQPGYPPRSTMTTLGAGANGAIKDLHENNSVNKELIIAGSFTELGESPCLNIGVYQNNNYSCLGNGLNGTIEGIISSQYTEEYIQVLVYGDFEENGIHYPLAKFENGAWSLIEISQRPNSIATTATGSVNSFLLSINVTNELHTTEVYSFVNGQSSLYAEVYGELYTMVNGYNGFYPSYGGDFDSIYLVTQDTMYYTNNVLFPAVEGYTTVEENIIDEVHHISFQGAAVYLAGHSTYQSLDDFPEPLVTRYMNGINQPLLTYNSILAYGHQFPQISTIKDQLFLGNYLYLAGDVWMPNPTWGIGGSGLLRVHLINGDVEFVTDVNGTGNRVISRDGQLILAGDFTGNMSNSSAGQHDVLRIGIVNEVYANVEETAALDVNVYPNPISENTILHIELPAAVTLDKIKVIDMKGSEIELETSADVALPHLAPGTYVLVIQTVDGAIFREKLLVQ